jgi:hypothetical protein
MWVLFEIAVVVCRFNDRRRAKALLEIERMAAEPPEPVGPTVQRPELDTEPPVPPTPPVRRLPDDADVT